MPASDFTVSAHSERYSNKLNVSSAVAALIGNHSVTRIWNRVTLSGTRYKHIPVRSAVAVHGDRRSRIGSLDSSCWVCASPNCTCSSCSVYAEAFRSRQRRIAE